MIPLPSGTKVWLATGHTDMRKGIGGLSLLVQEVLGRDPFCGHLFVFRGRRSDLIKIVWHDGQGEGSAVLVLATVGLVLRLVLPLRIIGSRSARLRVGCLGAGAGLVLRLRFVGRGRFGHVVFLQPAERGRCRGTTAALDIGFSRSLGYTSPPRTRIPGGDPQRTSAPIAGPSTAQ